MASTLSRAIITFVMYGIFLIGMVIVGFAAPPLQYVGLVIFLVALTYSFVEPQRIHRSDESLPSSAEDSSEVPDRATRILEFEVRIREIAASYFDEFPVQAERVLRSSPFSSSAEEMEVERLYEETLQRNKELAEINARLQTAQAQLIQSEKLASLGQLTAGIVHDVKKPLAVIQELAEVHGGEFNVDSKTRERLEIIQESARHANSTVTGLLKFARQVEPEFQRQDIRKTIESSVRLTEYLARESNATVEVDMPNAPVLVWFDAQQIEQVMINLLTNSFEALKHGGTVRINLIEAENSIAISVQDNGVGISEKNLHRIFDPFFSTKPDGERMGLGLSVSFGIIRHHGGQIDVDSKPGLGTTFTILMPSAQQIRNPVEGTRVKKIR